ncbi:MAG: hypothetical protein V2A61_05470 [Calditrichota bacterium]
MTARFSAFSDSLEGGNDNYTGTIPIRPFLSIIISLSLILALGLSSCRTSRESKQKIADEEQALKRQYYLLNTELKLSANPQPYLAIDFAAGEIQIKMKGVLLWNQKIQYADEDSGKRIRFERKFLGSEGMCVVRQITDKYLYAGKGRLPDTLLTLVSKALEVRPDLLQREIPSRFSISWGPSLTLQVYTEIKGEPKSLLRNAWLDAKDALKLPWEKSDLEITMPAEEALTLFRMAEPGAPTLLVSSSQMKETEPKSAPKGKKEKKIATESVPKMKIKSETGSALKKNKNG